jgi:hypothetical protein
MMTTNETAERAAGFLAAREEIKSDGWTKETAQAYLAAVTPSADPYSQGFDSAIEAFVLIERAKVWAAAR